MNSSPKWDPAAPATETDVLIALRFADRAAQGRRRGTEVAQTAQRLHTQAATRATAGLSPEDRRLLRNLLWTIYTNIEALP